MKRLTILAATALLVLPMVTYADSDDTDRWQLVTDQLLANFGSPVEAIRTQSIENTIYLATFHRDKISLNQFVGPLVALYDLDKDIEVRALALAALQTIETPQALYYLKERLNATNRAQVQASWINALETAYAMHKREHGP